MKRAEHETAWTMYNKRIRGKLKHRISHGLAMRDFLAECRRLGTSEGMKWYGPNTRDDQCVREFLEEKRNVYGSYLDTMSAALYNLPVKDQGIPEPKLLSNEELGIAEMASVLMPAPTRIPEIAALESCVVALDALQADQAERVIVYLQARYGLK
jgi:hypothetical protein